MKEVSVIILNWNGLSMLKHYLSKVVEYSPEADIVVADNGSTDGSIAYLKSDFPEVRVIAFTQNYGFAGGYNKAMEFIETPYSLLLNDDVEVTSGWLKPLLKYMKSSEICAACQPKIKSAVHPEHFEYAGACGGFMDILGYPFCRGRMLGTIEKDNGQYDEPCEIMWATGAAFMIRTDVFKDVGGFDPRFFAHMEEIDLCWRMRSRGWKIGCMPDSVVYHVGGGTLSRSNPHKTYLNFRNNLFMLYKNLPEKDLSRVMKQRSFLDKIALIKMFLTGNKSEAQAVIKARKEFRKRKRDFSPSRIENMKKATCTQFPGLTRKSLLVAYYIKQIKKFSNWNINTTTL